jgi:hypothetical protein
LVARSRRGIALPLVILVLAALGLMAALGLSDALLASRVAALAVDRVRAHAAALEGTVLLLTPPDLPWLCLQPPSASHLVAVSAAVGARAELRWWAVAPGRIRGEVTGVGESGARFRRLAELVPDSLPADSATPGCPDAEALRPAGSGWLMPHPEG